MIELQFQGEQLRRLEEIYRELEEEYCRVAGELNFSCQGCPDNCCDSYFLHHTYSEWMYLHRGFSSLPEERREILLQRARDYLHASQRAETEGRRPQEMCPLNEEGRCILYHHRLLVCRTHGVPARLVRPDGKRLDFPGCFRCQEVVTSQSPGEGVMVDRTPWLRRLALLEGEVLDGKRHLLPKMRKTIAEMLLQGPPRLPTPHCQRSAAIDQGNHGKQGEGV